MRLIPLTCGKVALVDDDDFEWLSVYTWHASYDGKGNTWYAATNIHTDRWRYVKMHQLILRAPTGFITDHRNRNGLDNQKTNLRICTESQNRCNIKPHQGRKYKGTYRVRKSFHAAITVNYIKRYLGAYKTEEQAARAYDAAAKLYHGEFAYLNFP